MSDMIDDYRAMGDHKKRMRAQYGVDCPVCKVKLPKACPTLLLPQQKCRVDGFRDPRPELTDEQYAAI